MIHGPVVYTDRLYETIVCQEDEVRRLAACLFAKPKTHAAQREYRFVVLNGNADEKTLLLDISGMMRDALAPCEHGLVRPSPTPTETVGEDGAALTRPVSSSTKQVSRQATAKERKEERRKRRVETRTSDGQVMSSDVEQEESVAESAVIRDLETDGRGIRELGRDARREWRALQPSALVAGKDADESGDEGGEDAVVNELALGERDWNEESGEDEFVIPVIHRGSGRTFRSFGDMLKDPTAPMNPMVQTWEASACSPEEIVKSYGAVATLATKIAHVAVEHRQEAASACWHALQCINHIFARLGDIVDSVWIERDRFVIIHIRNSEELKASGRIVIGPSGGYAYCFKSSGSEETGYGEEVLGEMFFPLGNHVETFRSYGWPGKAEGEQGPGRVQER